MTDQQHDEILQISLKALEDGADLQDVLRELPPDYRDIAALDRLAEASKALNHPRMSLTRAKYRLKTVVRTSRQQMGTFTGLQVKAIPLAFVLGLVTILITALLFFYRSGFSPVTRTAELCDTRGVIEISSLADPEKWSFAVDGDQVRAGMRIRTYIDSSTTLLYPDGSWTILAPESVIAISELSGNEGFIQVHIDQEMGNTDNQVVAFSNDDSHFIIDTVAGRTTVNGTRFSVMVLALGKTRVAVDEGEVMFMAANAEFLIDRGKAMLVEKDGPLDYPLYEFSLTGELVSSMGHVWDVAGVEFYVGSKTEINAGASTGDAVAVRGRILETGERLADIITLAEEDPLVSNFSGVVESVSNGIVVVNGRELILGTDAGIQVGDVITISLIASSEGGWQAIEYSLTKPLAANPITAAIQDEKPTLLPTINALPGKLDQTPVPILKVCEDGKQHPDALALAEKYDVSYDNVIGFYCQGFTFGEIDLAFEISKDSGKLVEDLFSLRTSGLDWDVIRDEFMPEETNTPEPTLEPAPTLVIFPTKVLEPTRIPLPEVKPLPTLQILPTKEPELTKEPIIEDNESSIDDSRSDAADDSIK